MRVLGIGVDIVDTSRIAGMIARHGDRFLSRALTPRERAKLPKDPSLPIYAARRIAAKEAVIKALGMGLRPGSNWHCFEVEDIRPGWCEVHPRRKDLQQYRFHVAISRHGKMVIAMCTLEGN